ncbi:hypothetical protein S225a_10460 [Candidatus Brocadiaceae bacterium S225]|nr:hypothetical protein S225a_10460 [Candidatus Brocadiaceae bacterium S225]
MQGHGRTFISLSRCILYWFPSRHYVRPEGTYYDQLLEKYKADQCIECHEKVTPGIVHDWRASTHADPKKNEFFAIRTRQIEELIERDLDSVDCSECPRKSIIMSFICPTGLLW